MPRLPRKNGDGCYQAKRNPCHAKCRGVTGDQSGPSAPPEPAQCPKCHACHMKRRWMSPSATPAMQSAAASLATNPVQARHQSQPSAPSATPATQNEGGCHQVPHLPRETKMDVTKRHVCHAKCRGVIGDQSGPSAPPEPAQCPKCHACHARRRWMSPSAMPAT